MKLFYLSSLLLLISCMSSKPTSEYITLLEKTTAQFNTEVLQEHHLACRGYGGKLMKDISSVSQHYLSVEKCDVHKARRLMVSCIEKLTGMINNNSKLHPFLHQNPFPSDRVQVSIAFFDKNAKRYTDSAVAYAFSSNGKIYYAKCNSNTKELEDLWEEDYSEALRIVRSETTPQVTNE